MGKDSEGNYSYERTVYRDRPETLERIKELEAENKNYQTAIDNYWREYTKRIELERVVERIHKLVTSDATHSSELINEIKNTIQQGINIQDILQRSYDE